MRHLVHILESLLSDHDCVVVPGLGGFLMNRTDAQYNELTCLDTPSYRQVSFNAKLTFNDGLLMQAYQQADGVSYNEASHSIRQAVADICQHLSAGESFQLGNIGTLRQTEDGRLVFTPLQCISLDADSFGLESIICQPVATDGAVCPESDDTQDSQHPVIDIAVWKWAVSVAACIFLAVAFPSRPLMQQSEPAIHYASVVSPRIIAQQVANRKEPVAETVILEEATAVDRPVALQNNNGQHYMVIIASLQTREEAEHYISGKKLRQSFPSAGITVGGDRYRVFAEKYDSKQEAVGRIESFRTEYPQYSQAWVTYGKPIAVEL